jgi:hypothetical protein
MFRKLIRNDALHNVELVTTMWHLADQVQSTEREKVLIDTDEFWRTMVRNGSTVGRFDGTVEGAYNIIQSLLNRTARILNIQKEMIDDHLQLAETEAGKEVLANLTGLKLQHERDISELSLLIDEAFSQNDPAMVGAWVEMSAGYDRKLTIAQAQIDALQSRNPKMEALQIRHGQEIKGL